MDASDLEADAAEAEHPGVWIEHFNFFPKMF